MGFEYFGVHKGLVFLGQTLKVRKKNLKSVLPFLRKLKDKGISRRRQRQCGARGQESFQDCWKWPKHQEDFLFPSTNNSKVPKTKDVVAHALIKSRRSFDPPVSLGVVNRQAIRSHSGRHRMVNDLKASGIPMGVGMAYARIHDEKTYQNYGRLVEDQVGTVLEKSGQLKRTLRSLYSNSKAKKAQRQRN